MAQTETPALTSLASGAISAYARVRVTGSSEGLPTVAVAGANQDFHGYAQRGAADGGLVPVRLRWAEGTQTALASKSFSAGATLYVTASGKVTDTAAGNGEPVAIALEASSGDNAAVNVLDLQRQTNRTEGPSFVTATNSSGGTHTAGVAYRLASGEFGVPVADIANSASGLYQIRGLVTFAKTGTFAVSVGQALGWDSTNTRAQALLTDGAVIRATQAQLSTDLTVTGYLNPVARTSCGRVLGTDSRVATNAFTNNLNFTPAWFDGYVTDNTGALKAGLLRTISGTTITISATAIAGTDTVAWCAREF